MTDAIVCLGYLDPKAFLGGRRELDVEQARKAIGVHVAEPLGLSVEAAARAVRDQATAELGGLVKATLQEADLPTEGTAMFTFGGNGPTLGAFVAEAVGIDRVFAFDLGPVFSAFGAAISDVAHVYERGVGVGWDDAGRDTILETAGDLHGQAERDLRGEGFDPGKAEYAVELEFGKHQEVAGSVRFAAPATADTDWFAAAGRAVAESGLDVGRWPLQLIRLSVRYAIGTQTLQKSERAAKEGANETRTMVFHDDGTSGPVYRWESLGPGSSVNGPAMINGATLTCPVPPGWSLRVDEYGNAAMQKG